MISGLISVIVTLIVIGLLWFLVGLLPLPAPIKSIVDVAFIIIAIIVVLGLFSGYVRLPHIA